MAFSGMPLAVFSCLALLAAAGARRPEPEALAPAPPPGVAGLAQRLEGEGSQQCWEALVDIKSCTGEIILFFLNGEAYLGPGCCRAIRAIEQRCWATDAMLSVIGFTPEEGDMLKGYCDAGDNGGSPPPQRAVAAGGGVAARESVAAVAGRKSASRHR
ncbi:egg cell-secreted protein 1.3-like [Panicum miliaceum]|uniref:Egg cell-secreted protein 1.3-like n=1 Tax=Panicum miliaceum TaxID=4540 RepID=A0A3L6TSY4_PANMI|nr:egg cell-secreted protein 1.3-like [Panicum miliaceum]